MKRVLSMMLAIMLVLGVVVPFAIVAEEVDPYADYSKWDGTTVDTSIFSVEDAKTVGDGTQTLVIDTAAKLVGFAQIVNEAKVSGAVGAYRGWNIYITKDIDLAGYEFPSIGYVYGVNFGGNLEGRLDGVEGAAPTISGLKITAAASNNTGFVGNLRGGSVKNLVFENAYVGNVANSGGTGIAVGYVSKDASVSDITVRNSTMIATRAASASATGAIVGTFKPNIAVDAKNFVAENVTILADGATQSIGGLVGLIQKDTTSYSFTNCSFSGTIKNLPESKVAGALIGKVENAAITVALDKCEFASIGAKGVIGSVADGVTVTVTDSTALSGGVALVGSGTANATGAFAISPTVWDGATYDTTPFDGIAAANNGNAVEGGPVIIDTAAKLAGFAKAVNDAAVKASTGYGAYKGLSIYITKNIDLAGYEFPVIGVGYSKAVFGGNLEGRLDGVEGKAVTISGFKMTTANADNAGFIGSLRGGSVKNLTFRNAYLENTATSGGTGIVVGYISKVAEISGITVIDSTINANTTSVGGIVGTIKTDNALTASNLVAENVTVQSEGGSIGGVLGLLQKGSTAYTFANCSFSGEFKNLPDGKSAGALIGNVEKPEITVTLDKCAMDVVGTKAVIGFANASTVTITDCESTVINTVTVGSGSATVTGAFKAPADPLLWDGVSYDTAFLADLDPAADGADKDAIIIDTAAKLAGFAKVVNEAGIGGATGAFANWTIYITKNIDLAGYEFDTIGYTYGKNFAGNLEGRLDGEAGKAVTISNLKITAEAINNTGFVGNLRGGSVKNFVFENAYVGNTANFGGTGVAVGYISKVGAISDITVRNSTIIATNKTGSCVGGIVGLIKNDASMDLNNLVSENVTIMADNAGSPVGGVIGLIQQNNATTVHNFNNCSFSGEIKNAPAAIVAGGLVGTAEKAVALINMTNCIVTGSVNGGAFIGNVKAGATITMNNCIFKASGTTAVIGAVAGATTVTITECDSSEIGQVATVGTGTATVNGAFYAPSNTAPEGAPTALPNGKEYEVGVMMADRTFAFPATVPYNKWSHDTEGYVPYHVNASKYIYTADGIMFKYDTSALAEGEDVLKLAINFRLINTAHGDWVYLCTSVDRAVAYNNATAEVGTVSTWYYSTDGATWNQLDDEFTTRDSQGYFSVPAAVGSGYIYIPFSAMYFNYDYNGDGYVDSYSDFVATYGRYATLTAINVVTGNDTTTNNTTLSGFNFVFGDGVSVPPAFESSEKAPATLVDGTPYITADFYKEGFDLAAKIQELSASYGYDGQTHWSARSILDQATADVKNGAAGIMFKIDTSNATGTSNMVTFAPIFQIMFAGRNTYVTLAGFAPNYSEGKRPADAKSTVYYSQDGETWNVMCTAAQQISIPAGKGYTYVFIPMDSFYTKCGVTYLSTGEKNAEDSIVNWNDALAYFGDDWTFGSSNFYYTKSTLVADANTSITDWVVVSSHTEHVWDDGEITTAPTHEAEGVKTYTCRCGETKTEAVPVITEHDYTYRSEITKEPTHTEEGVKSHYCVCGEATTEAIPKLTVHEWNSGEVTTEPTHTTEGVKTFTCTCGETKDISIKKLTDHEWNDGEVTTEPTHSAEGVKTYTCTCGETKTEAVEKSAEHVWGEGEVTTEPTATEDGVKTYTCECGETKTEAIPATGETQDDKPADDKPADDKPADDKPATDDEQDDATLVEKVKGALGCSGIISSTAMVAILTLGLGVTVLRKKED